MTGTRRIRQETFEPGESAHLDGTFVVAEGAGRKVRVHVTVGSCDDDDHSSTIDRGDDEWRVVVSPDTTYDVEGLRDADGAELVLTVAATGCPDSERGDSGSGDAPVGGGEPDVGATATDEQDEADAPPVHRDRGGVRSLRRAFDRTFRRRFGTEREAEG